MKWKAKEVKEKEEVRRKDKKSAEKVRRQKKKKGMDGRGKDREGIGRVRKDILGKECDEEETEGRAGEGKV